MERECHTLVPPAKLKTPQQSLIAMDSNDSSSYSPCMPMLGDRNRTWWIYLVTSLIIYVVCLGLSLLCFGIKWLTAWRHDKKIGGPNFQSDNSETDSNCWAKFNTVSRNFFRELLLGDSTYSKVFITVNLICNLVFLSLYTTYSIEPYGTVIVFTLRQRPSIIVEFIVIGEMFVYALVRFLASRNILLYWFNPYTIVDVLTLPHVIIAVILGVDWIGFRSLRFIWLTEVITVLQFVPYIKQTVINAVSVMIHAAVWWLTSSGILHLLETNGDPWDNFENAQCNSFPIYAYMIMVTVSTVGYGDFSPQTTLGRVFITFFILAGLALFAAMLPRLADITSSYYKSTQFASFDTSRVPRHVIVCGYITDITAEDFLKDFLHPDRGDNKTHILFLNSGKPDVKLRNVMRSYYTRVQYLDGSVFNHIDLEKAKIKNAHAVFILANKNTDNPTEEDHANLFRLVSVKNTTTDVPIIIQLLHGFSKKKVYNIDGWNRFQDVAICLNELKLGLLAQSCLCPGFSTLIANMFYTSDFATHSSSSQSDVEDGCWQDLYIKGASNEIYYSYFSDFFFQKDFHQAARFCFKNFKLMLLAIEHYGKIYVNPSTTAYPNLTIDENTLGYFIAQNRKQVSVIEHYVPQGGQSRRRSRRKIPEDEETTTTSSSTQVTRKGRFLRERKRKQRSVYSSRPSFDAANMEQFGEPDEILHDIKEPNELAKAILNPEMAFLMQPGVSIDDHIVVCIFSSDSSPLLGLNSFLNPLRNKLLPPESVKPVVIVCNKAFIEKEWTIIRNIPKVHVVVGSPLNWSNLKHAEISKAAVCVILTIPSGSKCGEHGINDKEPILCTLSLKKAKKHRKCNPDIQIITDLVLDSNVQFLDIGDEDKPDERIYETQLFACGEAFSSSMFDSVTSSMFHSPGIMQIVEHLIYPSGNTSLLKTLPISSTSFSEKKFVEFYESLLDEKSICLGLFRKIDEYCSQRFVITSPDPELILKDSDTAFVITE